MTQSMAPSSVAPLGLYVHVPFCTVKCSYCDFNSYAGIDDLQDAWEQAALKELALWAPRLSGREVSTVFIGGGTPSLLPGDSIQRLLDAVRSQLSLKPDAEITLEANPESVAPDRLAAYRDAGVNRVSMGVQSLNPTELNFLDRIHSAERAKEAFSQIRDAGFDNINLDLIYGLPRPIPRNLASHARTSARLARRPRPHLLLRPHRRGRNPARIAGRRRQSHRSQSRPSRRNRRLDRPTTSPTPASSNTKPATTPVEASNANTTSSTGETMSTPPSDPEPTVSSKESATKS